MNKYYVQSGSLKRIILSTEPFKACVRSLHDMVSKKQEKELSPSFIVSQRGFVMDRFPTQIYSDEEIYSTIDVFTEFKRVFNE